LFTDITVSLPIFCGDPEKNIPTKQRPDSCVYGHYRFPADILRGPRKNIPTKQTDSKKTELMLGFLIAFFRF